MTDPIPDAVPRTCNNGHQFPDGGTTCFCGKRTRPAHEVGTVIGAGPSPAAVAEANALAAHQEAVQLIRENTETELLARHPLPWSVHGHPPHSFVLVRDANSVWVGSWNAALALAVAALNKREALIREWDRAVQEKEAERTCRLAYARLLGNVEAERDAARHQARLAACADAFHWYHDGVSNVSSATAQTTELVQAVLGEQRTSPTPEQVAIPATRSVAEMDAADRAAEEAEATELARLRENSGNYSLFTAVIERHRVEGEATPVDTLRRLLRERDEERDKRKTLAVEIEPYRGLGESVPTTLRRLLSERLNFLEIMGAHGGGSDFAGARTALSRLLAEQEELRRRLAAHDDAFRRLRHVFGVPAGEMLLPTLEDRAGELAALRSLYGENPPASDEQELARVRAEERERAARLVSKAWAWPNYATTGGYAALLKAIMEENEAARVREIAEDPYAQAGTPTTDPRNPEDNPHRVPEHPIWSVYGYDWPEKGIWIGTAADANGAKELAARSLGIHPANLMARLGKLEVHPTEIRLHARVSAAASTEILRERQRQASAEGWTTKHDDTHAGGEMAAAAGAYILHGHAVSSVEPKAPWFWPWALEFWKPKDPRRNLIRAGALILAEIERLDRKAARESREKASSFAVGDPGDESPIPTQGPETPFCTKTPGCLYAEGHEGDCRP